MAVVSGRSIVRKGGDRERSATHSIDSADLVSDCSGFPDASYRAIKNAAFARPALKQERYAQDSR